MSEREEEEMAELEELHGPYWRFQEHMKQWYHDERGEFDPTQLIGYECQERIEEYAKTHKDEIVIIYCDDNYYTLSILVLIPHKSKKEYWGTTVIFVPQCSGIRNELFLCADSHVDLYQALDKMMGAWMYRQ